MSDLFLLSVNELSENISSRKISPVDLYDTFTQRIEKLNSKLNCFIDIFTNLQNNFMSLLGFSALYFLINAIAFDLEILLFLISMERLSNSLVNPNLYHFK